MPDLPYYNIGAGKMQHERGRDDRRAELRGRIAACKQRLNATTSDGQPISDTDRLLLLNDIARFEDLCERLGQLKYRNGRLITPFEDL